MANDYYPSDDLAIEVSQQVGFGDPARKLPFCKEKVNNISTIRSTIASQPPLTLQKMLLCVCVCVSCLKISIHASVLG